MVVHFNSATKLNHYLLKEVHLPQNVTLVRATFITLLFMTSYFGVYDHIYGKSRQNIGKDPCQRAPFISKVIDTKIADIQPAILHRCFILNNV